MARIVGREDCCNEVAPGLFAGRRPLAGELPSQVSLVVDLAAEFIECRAVRTACRYISAPVLDTGVMDEGAFVALVQEVAQWPGRFTSIVPKGTVAGHLATAVLLAKGHCDSVEAAVGQLRAARPRLALGKSQLHVRRVAGRLLPSGESACTAQAADRTDC